MLAAKGTEWPFNLQDMDEKDREKYIVHQHVSHFSDNKVLNNEINSMAVDIGTQIDWMNRKFTKDRNIIEEGEEWANTTTRECQEEAIQRQVLSVNNLVIPRQKDGTPYSVKGSPQQEEIIYTDVDTITKFLKNDPLYKPMNAIMMGFGGTGKSYIINTIIGMVWQLTNSNNTVKIAAPSGAAVFNVQGSTLHSLLNIDVMNPENELSEKRKE